MKKLAFILSLLIAGVSAYAIPAKNESARGYDGNAFIFQEGTVEFSVFPDGQFDFVYIGPQKSNRIIINSPNMNISFNSGYNYDAYVQYDMYGAVIQVEDIPIFYDHYGRIIQAGSVEIHYTNNRLVRVGGLHIFYNAGGYYSHYTGYINAHNRYYIYRPWHVHYIRPYYTHVIVYDYPYRLHYHPVRYTYKEHITRYNNRGRVNYANGRREFYRPGSRTHLENGRTIRNENFDPNRKNTMIADGGRNNRNNNSTTSETRGNNTTRNSGTTIRSNDSNNGRTNSVIRDLGKSNVNATANQQTGRNNTAGMNVRNNSNSTPVKAAPGQTGNVRTVQNPTRTTTPVKAAPQRANRASSNSTGRNIQSVQKKPAPARTSGSSRVSTNSGRSNTSSSVRTRG